jgi:hypothetical protein
VTKTLRIEMSRGNGWELRAEGTIPDGAGLDDITKTVRRYAEAAQLTHRAVVNGRMVAMVNPKRGSGYATLDWLRKQGIEPTRQDYIDAAYGGTPPEEWTFEHEAELPEHLQDPTMPDPWGRDR